MKNIDPFFEIAERHIFDSDPTTLATVEKKIIDEYFECLKRQKIHIPVKFKNPVIEDLKFEIRLLADIKVKAK